MPPNPARPSPAAKLHDTPPDSLPVKVHDKLADTCPRCGSAFHCGVNGNTPCACSALTLSAENLAALRSRYRTCLCLACLQAIQHGAQP